MGLKRSRPVSSAQLLAAAAIASSHARTSQSFLLGRSVYGCLQHSQQRPHLSALRSPHRSAYSAASASSAVSRSSAAAATASAVPILWSIPRRREPYGLGENGRDDPLPRTMEELYELMRDNPPPEQRPDDEPVLQPQDIKFVEEAVRLVFHPTESDSWWEEHGEEWDRMAEDPAASFSLGVDTDTDGTTEGFVWRMGDYFGEGGPEWRVSDEDARPFTFSAYKAGMLSKRGRISTSTEGMFEMTPFAKYWDEVPDLRVTKRVYGFNAVDHMAALKFIMNCTYNGLHGSADSRQSGHFLWGYVDQIDWMRRSGRLSTSPGSVKVDRGSWWGRVSFALTMAPLAAAVESGLWEEDTVSILDGEDLQLPEMRRAVRAWRRVWRFNDFDINYRVAMSMPVHDTLQERLRRAQWAAHLESLDAVDALYGEQFKGLPSTAEREFASGWCRAARLFAAAAAHTNIDRALLTLGAGYPPEGMLTDDCLDNFSTERKLERVPYDPAPDVESDPAVALKTRRCVDSVRWLGSLRVPLFAALCFLWRRACVSYPARRAAGRVLRNACYGSRAAKAVAWGRSLLFMFIPNLNYRKFTPPFGIDPAEEVDYDPAMEPRDPGAPPPHPPGYRTSNPLQRRWYEGRRPRPSIGGPDEDDDGLGDVGGGMFPPGKAPPDVSFEALKRFERETIQKLKRVKERHLERQASDDSGSKGEAYDGGRIDSGSGHSDAHVREARATGTVDGDSVASTIFM